MILCAAGSRQDKQRWINQVLSPNYYILPDENFAGARCPLRLPSAVIHSAAGRLFHEYRQCHTVMTKNLSPKDIIALGFMTFALFVGAGSIIFPAGGAAVRRASVAGRPRVYGDRRRLAGDRRDRAGARRRQHQPADRPHRPHRRSAVGDRLLSGARPAVRHAANRQCLFRPRHRALHRRRRPTAVHLQPAVL